MRASDIHSYLRIGEGTGDTPGTPSVWHGWEGSCEEFGSMLEVQGVWNLFVGFFCDKASFALKNIVFTAGTDYHHSL